MFRACDIIYDLVEPHPDVWRANISAIHECAAKTDSSVDTSSSIEETWSVFKNKSEAPASCTNSVGNNNNDNGNNNDNKHSPESNNYNVCDDGGPQEAKRSRPSEKKESTELSGNASRGFFPVHTLTTTDQVRLKAREMLQSALESGSK
ncbi:unnamed protein product [Schistosoma mattheei]|uniref:Uncharacterized protein n=1 Tax=Schistosoma mattheei TaxID=31246 RepID=A0A183P3L8_9TREM|nr:unnamed protein product [Schistosoma mattheei]